MDGGPSFIGWYRARADIAQDDGGVVFRNRLIRVRPELSPSIADNGEAFIWARKGQPASERRRLLFERWDACVEADVGDSGFRNEQARRALDELRQELARAARSKVIRFINEVAPRDSAEAYTASELAALNARRVSHERFAPYP